MIFVSAFTVAFGRMSTPSPTFDTPADSLPARGPDRAAVCAVGRRPWLARFARAIKEEIGGLGIRLLIANIVVSLLPSHNFCRLRTAIYRLAGLDIGERSLIFGRIEFAGTGALQHRLHIGADTMINVHFFADLSAEIHIGDRVSVGHHVRLVTAEHDVGPAACRAGKLRPKPICIQDGCWIGAASMILPGVNLGQSTIVSAGSLVSGNVPTNRMVGGVPARPLKLLPG
jgi:maltose O-acetyltransferase